ncbi:hypothetical protein [Aliarcobacter butzleri]|uniref:hypothetical protein n=1 Tax=Aliarcobacter butzleri TaxID=28197 RepID=UPI00344F1097
MLFTQYDLEKIKNDPYKLLEEIKQNVNNGDTKMIFAKEPVIEDYPKEEGIFFIHNKLINLEELSTENIANALKNYTDFMKKHKIQIIKEFDSKCELAYEGEIPHIKVASFETLSFYDFNKFHIIDGNTLSRVNSKNTLGYLKTIDYSYALDSNVASFFARYITNNDIKYKDLYNQIIAKENNIDIGPYIFEIVMHGLKDFGINYKLNKKNKNKTQSAFFETLKVLYKEGLFKEKLEKEFINNIIKSTNPLIKYYGMLGFSAQIFLLSLLEAKYKFGKAPNKIKYYVYDEMRKAKIPIENRLKAILYLFCDNPGHSFFKKVINIESIESIEKYMKDVDNTGRDIAISSLERYLYGISNIHPYIATNDQGLIEMFRSTKPDYVYVFNGIASPIYKKINNELQKKYLNFFETNNTKNVIGYQDSILKDLINIYINKKVEFVNLIKSK